MRAFVPTTLLSKSYFQEAITAQSPKEEVKAEQKKSSKKEKRHAEPRIEDEFTKTELPWMVMLPLTQNITKFRQTICSVRTIYFCH